MINLRAIRVDDEEKLIAFVNRLSDRSKFLRFSGMTAFTPEDARRSATVDYRDRFAMVAVRGEGADEKIIGVGRYHRIDNSNKAETFAVVEDCYQKMGIGTHLFVMLAYAAKERGVDFFEVEILRENTEVIKTMQRSGLELVGKSEKNDKWRATYRLVP